MITDRATDEDTEKYLTRFAAELTNQMRARLGSRGVGDLPAPEQVADRIGDVLIDLTRWTPENRLAHFVSPLWSAEKTRSELGVSRTRMSQRRREGTLLGLTTSDGVILYPVSQFESHAGQTRVRSGLRPFFQELLAYSPWTVAVAMHTPASELDDTTPLDWVRSGADQDVLAKYAARLDAEWSH